MSNFSSPEDHNNTTNTSTKEFCAGKYESYEYLPGTVYCNWTFDTILCWPPTEAGTIAQQNCPIAKGLDSTKFVERKCSYEGFWEGKPGVIATHNHGWSNYSGCYLPEVLELMRKIGGGEERDIKMNIAQRTRILEIVGFSLSLVALLISLLIFCRFRSLRNNRTRIHKHLFVAMVIQVIIRLTLYIDQAILKDDEGSSSSSISIDSTPYLCEAAYIFLEYARTAMFLWMFIEGLYLHNVVTVSVFQGRFPIILYALLGWGLPVIMTTIWAGFTAYQQSNQKCWFGYNLTFYYWILEGPRLFVILLNFIFLLNIIRVLVVKLRQSHESDVEQARKAVRAAFVLLPLLGITNLLNMSESPLERSPLEFAVWSYVTHFLTSFQGFFIAMLYCFLNGEVRVAIFKSISVFMSLRGHHDWVDRRQSHFSGYYATGADSENTTSANGHDSNKNRQHSSYEKPKSSWMRLFIKKRIQAELPQESVAFDISD